MLERIAWILIGLVIIVAGFFFLAAAVVAGVIIAGVIFVRLWWLKRKLAKEAESEFISTEYTVVEREALPRDSADERDRRSRTTDRGQ